MPAQSRRRSSSASIDGTSTSVKSRVPAPAHALASVSSVRSALAVDLHRPGPLHEAAPQPRRRPQPQRVHLVVGEPVQPVGPVEADRQIRCQRREHVDSGDARFVRPVRRGVDDPRSAASRRSPVRSRPPRPRKPAPPPRSRPGRRSSSRRCPRARRGRHCRRAGWTPRSNCARSTPRWWSSSFPPSAAPPRSRRRRARSPRRRATPASARSTTSCAGIILPTASVCGC